MSITSSLPIRLSQHSEQKFATQLLLTPVDGFSRTLKFLAVVAGLCIAIIFSSCKKECRKERDCSTITAVLHSSGKWSYLSYNAKGKLTRLSSGASVTTYEYTSDSVTVLTFDSGKFFTKCIITLNARGMAANVRTEKNITGTNWFYTTYEYSGENLIKSTVTVSDGGTPMITTYTWENQNMTSIISGTVINTFGYDADKPSQKGDSFFLTQLFQGYEIYRNKNLLKSISGVDLTYETGPVGIVSAIASVRGNNTDIVEYRVIYQCL